jgi:hypothetical protein
MFLAELVQCIMFGTKPHLSVHTWINNMVYGYFKQYGAWLFQRTEHEIRAFDSLNVTFTRDTVVDLPDRADLPGWKPPAVD